MVVCLCYNLTKETIRKAVDEKGLTDAAAVYTHFKMDPCGACEDDVSAIAKEQAARSKE